MWTYKLYLQTKVQKNMYKMFIIYIYNQMLLLQSDSDSWIIFYWIRRIMDQKDIF